MVSQFPKHLTAKQHKLAHSQGRLQVLSLFAPFLFICLRPIRCDSAHVLHQVQQDLRAKQCHPRLTLHVSYVLGVLSSSYVFPLQRPPWTPSRLQITTWQCQQISHSHCLCLRVSQKHHHQIVPQRWQTTRMHQHSGALGSSTWPTMPANLVMIVLM